MLLSRRGFLRNSLGAAAAVTHKDVILRQFAASAFTSGALDGPIPLNVNINPYGPSPKVIETMQSMLPLSRTYPDPKYEELILSLAHLHGVGRQQVLLGCGSMEILRSCINTFVSPGRTLVMADPTYKVPADEGRRRGATVILVRLNRRFQHDLEAMLTHANDSTGLVYICNPNNPTGTVTPRKELELFISKLPQSTYVLLDEAYHHYCLKSQTYDSFIDSPIGDPRVIVTRTFSAAYGLAGMRIGYAVGASSTLSQLRGEQLQSAIGIVSARAAQVAVEDTDYLQLSIKRNADDRQEFFNQAQARMLKPISSQTNFFMMYPGKPARKTIEYFRQNNILIGEEFPSMPSHVRVSLGWPEQMQEFWRLWDRMPGKKLM